MTDTLPMSVPAIHRTEVDGVPVVWVEGPQPLAARLVFRVGLRDETFVTAGITHLVEHLAMSTLGRRHLEHNASVDLGWTVFEASGPAPEVVRFLGDVCAALRDLPLERIGSEAQVLAAEGGSADHPIVGGHLVRRVGMRGPGLAGVAEPALEGLTAEQVREWAARHFVRGNAALALTGPVPDGLRLDLPTGTVPPRAPVTLLDQPLPAWDEQGGPGFGLSFLAGARDPALLTALRIATERGMDELRHARALLYQLDFSLVDLERGATTCAVLFGDAPERHADAAWQGLAAILDTLAAEGPTDAELAHDLDGMLAAFTDPRSAEMHATDAAMDLLSGEPVQAPADAVARRRAVSREDCIRALAGWRDTLLVTVPEEVTVRATGLPRLPQSAPLEATGAVTGERFRRRLLSPVPRGGTLVVGTAGVAVHLRDGPLVVRWGDLVGCGVDADGVRTLVGVDGTCVPVHPDWFRDGARALALLEERVPPALRFVDRTDERPERPEPPAQRRESRASTGR